MRLSYQRISCKYASLVQLVERRSPKPDVEGSSPSGRELNTNNAAEIKTKSFNFEVHITSDVG